MAASVYVFHDTAVAAGVGLTSAESVGEAVPLDPGDTDGEPGAVVVPSVAVAVPDSDVFGREVAVELTCGPLFSVEHAAVAVSRDTASADAASLLGMRCGFMSTA
ncbi:hypothetical protein [Arthrobacter sp. yr096]|uniref:hypothetical protein n=1 Tax=Arthrobacter sp. yr096 TaxID=1761750 RepID=UPI0035294F76